MAGTNLDKGRCLGRRPHRRPDRLTGATNAGCHTTLASQCHPRLAAAMAGRPEIRPGTSYCGWTTNTRARQTTAVPRSLGSAAFPERATAHTVGRSGRPSCIVAAQYISLRLDYNSCFRAEIEPYARCAAIRGESTRNRTTSSIAAASVNGLPSALCVLEFPDTAACCAKPSPRPSCPRGLGRCNILMRFRAMIS